MPELPEVETVRRDLEAVIVGLKIDRITVLDPRVIRMPQDTFVRRLTGQKVTRVLRRGKVLLLEMSGRWLLVQLMMTGQLIAGPRGRLVPSPETRIIFDLSKGSRLFYNDQRLFGRLQVVEDPQDLPHLQNMGPEPLERDFSLAILRKALKSRRVAVKTLLMDHRVIAGIGNIYASEILFRAGISPVRKALDLTASEISRLHKAIRKVLKEAVLLRGTSMRNYRDGRGEEGKYLKIIKVYGRDGEPCRVCGKAIKRIVQAQRSTFYCPGCQS